MAQHLDNWVTNSELRKNVQIKESTLNNAITGSEETTYYFIHAKPGVSGTYRLPTKSFAVWIRAFTKAREEVAVHLLRETPPMRSELGPI